MTESERPPFDTIVVRLDGGEVSLDLGEFLQMPFHERIRAILAGGLAFYDGKHRVDTQAALLAIRRLSTSVRSP